MCLHPFDQKKLPCQDFLCLSCVYFWHWRVFNNIVGCEMFTLWGKEEILNNEKSTFIKSTCPQ
jgi:hypothetical protein